MKFCPNCGAVRDNKDICDCGYNYLTGEIVERKSEDNEGIQPFLGSISLDELKRRRLDVGDLLSVSYCSSGGMMGSYYDCELFFDKKEIIVIEQEWHHANRTKKVYKVNVDISPIKQLIIDNNLRAWSEIPIDQSMIAYDAPSSSMSLRFEQKTVSISTNIYMNDEEREIFIKVRSMVYELINNDNLISDEVITDNMMGNNSAFGMLGIFNNKE